MDFVAWYILSAKALHVPTNRMTGIVNGERSITAGTALRLARFFGTTPEFWLNLQTHYDLTIAARLEAKKIEREVEALPDVEERRAAR